MKFDKNLVAIHAYLCADGYVVKNPETQKHKYYRIGFRNMNLILLKDFQKKFESIFGTKPIIRKEGRCEKGSKEIYEKLNKIFGSFYSWKWRMPKIKNAKLLQIWLRAYFDCEGWVICKTHQNRHIGADCVNEIGIKQIQESLNKLDIKSKIKKRNDRNIFTLNICGKENLIKFNNKIGFLHPAKKEKLREVVNDFVNYYWEFPKEKRRLKYFVTNLLLKKAKIKKSNKIVYIISNKEVNLIILQKSLKKVFNIETKLNKCVNGIGAIYFQLNINKHAEIEKAIQKNLLNNDEKLKWLNLKK
tara:strand:+ start:2254 stop:3159 length:906 start_codon:yes stop_codon:yes gene_type:complete